MKKIFTAFVIIYGFLSNADAQTAISNEKIFHDGKNVTVTFDLDTDNPDIPSRHKEVILPYLYNGKDTLYLDAMEIYGKGRYKRERQVNAINGDRKWELSDNQTLKNKGTYTYVSQVPLKRWMTVARLGLRRQLVGCACEKEMPADSNIAQAELFKVPEVVRRTPSYVLTQPSANWDFGKDELEIIFKVSRTEIDSSVFNNEVTFGKILSAIDKIYSYQDCRVEKIEVAGYASPEGPKKFNTWLGNARAKALIDYIIRHRPQYNLTEEHFNIRNGEENWEGLRRMVAVSEMDHKDEVVAIIDNDSIPAQLKKQWIQKIDKGRVWNRMLTEIYPHLRCSRYLAVYYTSADDSALDAVEQANRLVEEGEYAQAYDLLLPHQQDPRTFNTIGVSLMMQKMFEQAMPWFEKARETGCPSAQKNIDAVNAEYEHEARQRNEIEEYLNRYN